MPFPIFKISSGQFRAPENSIPGPSKAEKLIGSGKKILRLPPGERFLEPIQKTLFQCIVGRAMFLMDCVYRCLTRICIYGNQGLVNNLSAESI